MTTEETYIVTGATGGIGRAIVNGLIARRVPRIILACRNTARAEAMIASLQPGSTHLEARPLDLIDSQSVNQFANSILHDGISIKALFNNAGIMPGGVTLSPEGNEAATQTNLISTVRLTEALLPAIIPGGAIVFTTSMTRRIARFRRNWRQLAIEHHNRFVTYGRSKKMLTAYALQLSHRLAQQNIRVNCSDPGIVDSGIITMGHLIIDRLCNIFFRPIIYTPDQGAAPALQALDTSLSGHIFTLRHSGPIPASYVSPLTTAILSTI